MDDREKVVRILELLEKTVGNLDWVQIRLESPKHCSDTITKIKEAIRMLVDLNRYADSLNLGKNMPRNSLQKIIDVLES